eukprot:2439538-Rhodomonas_salina.1
MVPSLRTSFPAPRPPSGQRCPHLNGRTPSGQDHLRRVLSRTPTPRRSTAHPAGAPHVSKGLAGHRETEKVSGDQRREE